MYTPQELLSLFEARREALGLTQAALGQLAFGRPDNTAIQNLRKGSSPAFDRVAALADALGLELYLGPPRSPPTETVLSLDAEDYAALPLYNVEVSAGPGRSGEEEELVDHLAFRRAWLRERGIDARTARLVRARGDSMEPIIRSGDLVMIDTSKRTPRQIRGRGHNDMYVLRNGDGELRLKWVDLVGKSAMIVYSENLREHPPEVFQGAASMPVIVGQVVWWGHSEK